VSGASDERLNTWQSLKAVSGSWRLLSVALLSFASGLPLGLVWIAIPTWMARAGGDIKVVGLFTLVQAPWSFKFLWSPLMDRYPLPLLGRKRGWILASQVALFGLGLWLAGVSDHPEAAWVIGALALAIALSSATQDIAIDAYAVEVLHEDEHGMAVGARLAFYRAAMLLSGGFAITLAASTSWAYVNALLACCYLPLALVTWLAPEPEVLPEAPGSLRDAVWGPFFGFLRQHRALEILAFVVLFKLSDNMTQGLLGPFFVQVGFDDFDVGVARATIGSAAIVGGTFLGGLLCQARGLGPALWISGLLQVFSNLGYAIVAVVGPARWVMYGAQAFEYTMSGLGNGAFGVLLLRLTQKRFSATQYALLSSLFSIPRVVVGPPVALLVDWFGWRDFFIMTLVAGVPGLVMLQRFAPLGVRDPRFHVAAPARGKPVSRGALALSSAAAGLLTAGLGALAVAGLASLRRLREGQSMELLRELQVVLTPDDLAGLITLAGVGLLGLTAALGAAATLAARRGIATPRGVARPGEPPERS
jgi:PAT family beta-lactamase induction signal transducer AmpG